MKSLPICLVIFLLPLLAACGPTGKEPCPYQLEPMYGEIARTGHCKEADEAFMADIARLNPSRVEAAGEMARLGFDYLNKGDLRTAMLRFNQAWLLDSDNCSAFNGFGIIKHARDNDINEAVRMFEKGLELCPNNSLLMADYGLVLEETYQVDRAISLFERSLKIRPDNLESYTGLIRSHLRKGDAAMALQTIHRGQKHGLVIDLKLILELERRVEQAR